MKSFFDEKEKELVYRTDFLNTKRSVLIKIEKLLAEVSEKLSTQTYELISLEFQGAKISRGENYKGLPYLILDHPRFFTQTSVFTYRTMFWWGNFFSSTLHISGESLGLCRGLLVRNYQELFEQNVFFCVNDTPWEYHFSSHNYLPIEKIKEEVLLDMIKHHPFIKLSQKYSIQQVRELPEMSRSFFALLMNVLTNSDSKR